MKKKPDTIHKLTDQLQIVLGYFYVADSAHSRKLAIEALNKAISLLDTLRTETKALRDLLNEK